MNRIADLYQKSDTDACLFTRRGDMAELLMVNPSTGASKHIYMFQIQVVSKHSHICPKQIIPQTAWRL